MDKSDKPSSSNKVLRNSVQQPLHYNEKTGKAGHLSHLADAEVSVNSFQLKDKLLTVPEDELSKREIPQPNLDSESNSRKTLTPKAAKVDSPETVLPPEAIESDGTRTHLRNYRSSLEIDASEQEEKRSNGDNNKIIEDIQGFETAEIPSFSLKIENPTGQATLNSQDAIDSSHPAVGNNWTSGPIGGINQSIEDGHIFNIEHKNLGIESRSPIEEEFSNVGSLQNQSNIKSHEIADFNRNQNHLAFGEASRNLSDMASFDRSISQSSTPQQSKAERDPTKQIRTKGSISDNDPGTSLSGSTTIRLSGEALEHLLMEQQKTEELDKRVEALSFRLKQKADSR